jgi:hypothetical protein
MSTSDLRGIANGLRRCENFGVNSQPGGKIRRDDTIVLV